MTSKALILFAHGSRDPEWAMTLQRICQSVRKFAPDTRVEPAFLEFGTPSLPDCAASLIASGFQRIVVVPVFLARGGHLKQDLPLLMESLRQRYPDTLFELSAAIGEVDSVVNAMAEHIAALP